MSKRSRVEAQLKQEELHNKTLKQTALLFKFSKNEKRDKKRDFIESDFLKINEFKEVRDRFVWKKKSYNKENQKKEFLKHLYFKYEAPVWAINMLINLEIDMKKSFNINNTLKAFIDKEYILETSNLNLLNASMQGKGYKELFSPMLTNKEIHYLINSKEEDVASALLEAKLQSFKLNKNKLSFLKIRFNKDRLFSRKNLEKNSLLELLYFFAKHDLEENAIQEIYDYFKSLIVTRQGFIGDLQRDGNVFFENQSIPAKEFFKKSLGTIIELSNKYHVDMINLKNKKYTEWNKKFEDFIIDEKYLFTELNSSSMLLKEGAKMKHCVGGYAERCYSGRTQIISLKNLENETNLLTIEVVSNNILQVKRKFNINPTEFEVKLVKQFANQNNLKY